MRDLSGHSARDGTCPRLAKGRKKSTANYGGGWLEVNRCCDDDILKIAVKSSCVGKICLNLMILAVLKQHEQLQHAKGHYKLQRI